MTRTEELVALAQQQEREGRWGAARALFEEAIRSATPAEGARFTDLMRWVGRCLANEGDAAGALDALEAALAIAEQWGNTLAAGHALNVQALIAWQRGDMDEAERVWLLARQRALQAGDARLAGMTAANLGVLANIRGDYGEAEQHYRAAISSHRTQGLEHEATLALNNLGLLFTHLERWTDAEAIFREGLAICERTGETVQRTQMEINLADLWLARGEHAQAQAMVQGALERASRAGDAAAIGRATRIVGAIASDLGRHEEAERHFARADEVALARGDVLQQAEIARDRATLARRMGRNREVLQQLNRARALFTQLRARPGLADVGEKVGQLEQEFVHVARRWGESIEAKDRYTQGHCQRVADLACAIAAHSGMDEATLFWFRIGALLHDVGKIVIPAEVLNKPGRLDEGEWELMRSHTTAGASMLADIDFPWDVRPMIVSHHERWDGTGYPHGLAGEAIPVVARMLTVADVYDALTSVRSYKRALTHDEAMTIMRSDVGRVFDPLVFSWFEACVVGWLDRQAAPGGRPVTPLSVAALGVTAEADGAEPRVREALGAEVDELTQLPTRRAFREAAAHILEARRTTGRPVSVLVVDIDRFTLINDTFGHATGDAALRLVAQRLRELLRPVDFAARYAGDEFVVLLPGTRLVDACLVAERLREAVAALVVDAGPGHPTCRVTVSIGAASAPLHGDTLDAIFGAADSALYGAKRAGRNAVTSAGRAGGGRHELLLDTFVGREAEGRQLRDLLALAVEGRAQLVALVGETGVGKSALLRQLGPDLGMRAGAMLTGQCREAAVELPYGPWADVVLAAHRAGLVPPRPWRELSHLVPEVAATAAGAAAGSTRALLGELAEFLRLASTGRPLLVVLDDMQWADPASWDALEFVTNALASQPLLLCLTVRAELRTPECDARLRRLSRSERFTSLPLPRLAREEVAEWLRAALAGTPPSGSLVELVMAQSEGNAFFVVETLRGLEEAGRLHWSPDGWQFEEAEGGVPLPAVNDLLARRLEGLSREARHILALAAVLGREFDPEVLVAAHEGAEAQVQDALDEGLAAAVLESVPRARQALCFTHARLVELLTGSVNPLRLRRLHERAARALEAVPSHDAGALASHFDQAGMGRDAYRTALEAGRQAQGLYAYDVAVERYRIARRHADGVAEVAGIEWLLAQVEELAGHPAEAEAHCELLLAYGTGAEAIGVARAARRMRERLRLQRGVPAAEVAATLEALRAGAQEADDRAELAAVLVALSTVQQRLGAQDEAERLAREAVTLADELGAPDLQAEAVMRLGSVLLVTSPTSAVPLYRRALDLAARTGDRPGQVRCHINVGIASDRSGNHPAAEVSYHTAIAMATDIRAGELAGVASINLGVLQMKTGRFEPARARFDDALAAFGAGGQERLRLAALYNLALLAHARRDAAGALELYDASAMLAASLDQLDVEVGATAGAGLAELELRSGHGAREQWTRARDRLGERAAWFQGRELWEALSLRLAAADVPPGTAEGALVEAVRRVEQHDPYAALWLGAECSALFVGATPEGIETRERLLVQARALGYAPLVARLTEQVAGDPAPGGKPGRFLYRVA
ncbi:MAG: diguanylate cyclase [Gemmatimonadetes bacterium]|nr:diguanylate cyclase [Gemmatimonadota bacterium]